MIKENVTINTVAQVAGVSKTTVSRYLNGKYEFMSENTKEKIKKTIEKLNYQPINYNRSIKSKNNKLIGLITNDIASAFGIEFLKGIDEVISKTNYILAMQTLKNDRDFEIEAIKKMVNQKVDGIILNGKYLKTEDLKEINLENIPLVISGRTSQIKDVDSIVTDMFYSIEASIEELKKVGYEEFGIFANNVMMDSQLFILVKDMLKNKCKTFNEDNIYFLKDNAKESCIDAIKKFKIGGYTKKAAIVLNSKLTLAMLAFLEEENALMENFAMCGFDNIGFNKIFHYKGIFIQEAAIEIGREITKTLLEKIEDDKENIPILKTIKPNIINNL